MGETGGINKLEEEISCDYGTYRDKDSLRTVRFSHVQGEFYKTDCQPLVMERYLRG